MRVDYCGLNFNCLDIIKIRKIILQIQKNYRFDTVATPPHFFFFLFLF